MVIHGVNFTIKKYYMCWLKKIIAKW
jgi:hypothetical protein